MAVDMKSRTNEFDTDTLRQIMTDVTADPAKAKVGFGVKTNWTGGCRAASRVEREAWRGVAGRGMNFCGWVIPASVSGCLVLLPP